MVDPFDLSLPPVRSSESVKAELLDRGWIELIDGKFGVHPVFRPTSEGIDAFYLCKSWEALQITTLDED
jgi:hypothetical protein